MEQGRKITEGLWAVDAGNASAMTGPGTTTYLLGAGCEVAVIDPGPDMPDHMAAIMATLGPDQHISHILVTHPHLDHSAGVPALKALTKAPVYAYGGAETGRAAVMSSLVQDGMRGGSEGVDHEFQPDKILKTGDMICADDWTIEALWTPGHMSSHLAYHWKEKNWCFCGDLIMGWSSSLISPPDGDLTQYYASLDLLEARAPARLLPTHGAPIETPLARIAELRDHRRQRGAQLLEALRDGPATLDELVARIYTETPPYLHPLAARNLLAELIAGYEAGQVIGKPHFSTDAHFFLKK